MLIRVVVAAVAAAAVIAAVLLILRFRRPTFVIGTEAAEGAARQRAHRERFAHLASPLPSLRYGSRDGTLIDPRVTDVDRELRSICSRFAASSADERRDFRNAATADDFYELLLFARRSAVFALPRARRAGPRGIDRRRDDRRGAHRRARSSADTQPRASRRRAVAASSDGSRSG